MDRLLLISLFFTAATMISVCEASQVPPERFFQASERQVFTLKYIDTTAGEAELETLGQKQWDGRPAYHFRATVRTTGLIGVIYPYTQTIDLYLDREKAVPLFVDINIHDRQKVQHTQIRLDSASLRGEELEDSTEPGEPPKHRRKQWDIPSEAQSLWSILTFLRLQQLTPGNQVVFPVAHDEKNATFAAEVVGAEPVPTAKGERPGVRLKILKSFTERFYPNLKEDPLLWFSDDARRTLLRFEFKHKLGKIFAVLRS